MQAPEKAKPGRKPLADGSARTARIEIRCLESEKDTLARKAQSAGVPLSQWLVQAGLNAKR
jgi:uncharacterized protein (DUF1778 family)